MENTQRLTDAQIEEMMNYPMFRFEKQVKDGWQDFGAYKIEKYKTVYIDKQAKDVYTAQAIVGHEWKLSTISKAILV